MRAIKTLMAFLLAAALMQNFALAQKREFKAAIKNEVYSFDGYAVMEVMATRIRTFRSGKKAISKDELFSFAKKNGYYIEAYATDKVVQFGESMIAVTKVLMLPEGAQPNPEKGHLNPADEPYKSINAVVNEMIRKEWGEESAMVQKAILETGYQEAGVIPTEKLSFHDRGVAER